MKKIIRYGRLVFHAVIFVIMILPLMVRGLFYLLNKERERTGYD